MYPILTRDCQPSHMSHPSDAVEILDDSTFQDLLESLVEPAAVAAIYSKFLGNAATFIRELAGQDSADRIDTLHTLKGSAAMLGANRISALAAQLQADLHGGIVQVEQGMRQLDQELTTFRVAVTERLQAAGGSIDA